MYGMRHAAKAVICVTLAISPCVARSAESGSEIRYLSFDGHRELRVLSSQNRFGFFSPDESSSGHRDLLGSGFKDCGNAEVKCASFGKLLLFVPARKVKMWSQTFDGYECKDIKSFHAWRRQLMLVSCFDNGEAYIHFTYSREIGIESISFLREGASEGVATTYYLEGKSGIFGDPVRKMDAKGGGSSQFQHEATHLP